MIRNIIIVAGQNAVGKTTAINEFMQEARQRGIPYKSQAYSDLFFELQMLKLDDAQGGLNHYHEWSVLKEGGHSHLNGESDIPFIITNNKLMDDTFANLFRALTDSGTDKFIFLEWAGGCNINSPEEPASRLDISFQRIGNMLQEGVFSHAWLEKVYGVIHITANKAIRYELNTRKHATSLEDLATGTFSPQKGAIVLDIFGKDDFLSIKSLLQAKGITIYSVENDATPLFYERLREVSKILFL